MTDTFVADAPGASRPSHAGPGPARETKARAASGVAATLSPLRMDDIPSDDRKAVLSTAAKELASSFGAKLLRVILVEKGITMRQLARESGFNVSVLSNIANGKRVNGPELWTLFALAEAMELKLELSVSPRR